LVLKLLWACPREAILLIGNLHTIGLFARHINLEGISHIHAYFLSWPATVGLALSTITGRSFSISAHARDVFVEHGAMTLKIARAKFLAACTQQGLDYLKANLPPKYHDKLHLNYHGTRIHIAGFGLNEKGIRKSKNDQSIIGIGRMVPKKGFGNLLQAFALVVRERPGCRLMILGEGCEQQRLKRLVEQLALEDHVRLVGWKEPDVTLRLLKQATIAVVPSVIADDGDRDGIPNVILEAFAVGTPVIASDLQGISEVIRHRQTGLLVEPGDVKGLALAINELLNNRHLRNQLSQRARETVVRRFDCVKNIKRLAELFMDRN
jgi:glycosyltransferase involved in cell wall biosynthesis